MTKTNPTIETFEVDDIDSSELHLALRDLIHNATRAAARFAEADCRDDWAICHIAMEEVAKCAVDLMAHAERRAR